MNANHRLAIFLGIVTCSQIAAAQVTVPFTSLNYSAGAASCSSSKGTNFIPFKGSFTCSVNPGQTGCVAKSTLYLNTAIGGVLPYQCGIPAGGAVLPINTAKIELSGVKIGQVNGTGGSYIGSPSPFAELTVSASNTYQGILQQVRWQVVANWKNTTSAMVDKFEVMVSGVIVWTTDINSHIIVDSTSCTNTGSTCGSTTFVNVPGGWIYGGSALSSLSLKFVAPPGTLGQPLSRIFAELDDGSSTGSTVFLKHNCTLAPLSQVQCDFSTISLVGAPGELGPESFLKLRTSLTNPAIWNENFPTGPAKQSMNCGLKLLDLTDSPSGINTRNFGALWFGADSLDCNWSPGPIYNFPAWYAWSDAFSPALPHDQRVGLDATRLK